MKRADLVKQVERRILLIRGHKVILDKDLAEFYGVSVGRLNEAVKRRLNRFPRDFMFQLTKGEFENLISQFAISSSNWGGRRHPPYAFTEQGVAMLSSVLNSERSARVNIAIMRAFVRLRQMLAQHKKLGAKLNELERKLEGHDVKIQSLFEVIRQLIEPPDQPRRRIGFHQKGGVKNVRRG